LHNLQREGIETGGQKLIGLRTFFDNFSAAHHRGV
jgi:hypothetical protein